MTRRRRRGRINAKGVSPQLARAKAIVTRMTTRGATPATTIEAAIKRAGISVRTYRTARSQIGTIAVRRSRHQARRGHGRWYAKRR